MSRKPSTSPGIIVDDWGLSPSINDATLDLAQRGMVYGVSLLAPSGDTPYFEHRLDELLSFASIKIGAHVNFTHPGGFNGRRLVKIITKAHTAAFGEEFRNQVRTIKARCGRLDYVDGHHHVHLLPGVIHWTGKWAEEEGFSVRVLDDKSHFGSWALAQFARFKIPENRLLSCGYLVQKDFQNPDRLKIKFTSRRPLVSHPSTKDDFARLKVNDSLRTERVIQYQTLMEMSHF